MGNRGSLNGLMNLEMMSIICYSLHSHHQSFGGMLFIPLVEVNTLGGQGALKLFWRLTVEQLTNILVSNCAAFYFTCLLTFTTY